MHRTPVAILVALAASAGAGYCAAALVVTADDKASGDQGAFAAQVLADDLVNVGRPTLASVSVSNYEPFLEFGSSASSVDAPDFALNNGILGDPTSNGPTMAGGTVAFSLTDFWSVTFALNLGLSPAGYDLTAIHTHTPLTSTTAPPGGSPSWSNTPPTPARGFCCATSRARGRPARTTRPTSWSSPATSRRASLRSRPASLPFASTLRRSTSAPCDASSTSPARPPPSPSPRPPPVWPARSPSAPRPFVAYGHAFPDA